MKIFKIILFSLLGTLLLLNGILYLLFNVPAIQTWATSFATEYLAEKTGTKVELDRIQINVFDGLYLHGLYVEDLRHDTLLYVDNLNVDYSLKALYKKGWFIVKRVALEDFTAKLSAENDSADFNFQFIIDAFSDGTPSDTTSSDTKLKLAVDNIFLRNGTFAYDILDAPLTPDTFNASHIRVDSLVLNTDFKLILPNDIQANIQNLAVKEKSTGLTVNHLAAPFALKLDSILISLPQLDLSVNHTYLNVHDIAFNVENSRLSATIDSSSILPSDFSNFLPLLNKFSSPISLSATAEGQLPQIKLTDLSINYPQNIRIKAPLINVDDYSVWDSTQYQINIAELELQNRLPQTLKNSLELDLPPIVDSLLPSSVSILAKGSLLNLNEQVEIATPIGTVATDGSISYNTKINRLLTDNDIKIDVTTLFPIIQSGIMKDIHANFQNHLDWNLGTAPLTTVNGDIFSVNLFDYQYDTIHIKGTYHSGDEATASIQSTDPNCSLSLSANVQNLLSDSMDTNILLNTEKLNLGKLNIVDSLPFNTFAGEINIDGVGMDYNKWHGEILLTDLEFKTDSSHLSIDNLSIKQKGEATKNDSTVKDIWINAPFIMARINGNFNYDDIYSCAFFNLKKYIPTVFTEKTTEIPPTTLHYNVSINNTDSIFKFMGIDLHLLGNLKLKGEVSNENGGVFTTSINTPPIEMGKLAIAPSNFNLKGNEKHIFGGLMSQIKPDKEIDFSAVVTTKIFIRNDSIYNYIELGTTPDSLFLQGGLMNCISFHPSDESFKIRVNFYKNSIKLFNQEIVCNEAVFDLPINDEDPTYKIENFGLSSKIQPLLTVNGLLSSSISDTLVVNFDNLKFETLLALAYRTDIPAQFNINGQLKACAILGENSRFFTRDFKLDSIFYNGNFFGSLTANAIWDSKQKGVGAKMLLTKDNRDLMTIRGVVSPAKQRMRLRAILDSVPLEMAVPFTSEYVSNLKGYIGSNIAITGPITDPEINGYLYLTNAQAKINYTGVTYFVSDSIKMDKNHFFVRRLKVRDNFGKILFFHGDVTHEHFKHFDYNMMINMRDFALLNNPKDRDKIAYGTFFANARRLQLKGDEKHAVVTGEFSNADNTALTISLPDFVTEASTYDNIVYVSNDPKDIEPLVVDTTEGDNFDISANLILTLTDKATFNVNIADGAMIRGNGSLQLLYENNVFSIFNRFTVNDGFMKIKIVGLPTKKFNLQEGSYVEFNGDPMNLRFNATAAYELTADLATLSSSFSSMTTNTRVPVSCDLKASGNLNDMKLSYDVSLPKSDEDIKQSLASIINTDNVKLKEFAYLIGIGMFNDPTGQAQGDAMVMSFASSSLSSAINNVLGGVLGNKISIGTDLNSSKEDFSDLEASVSVSTKLAHDKLLLSTNLGVQQNEASNESSFLGDFDAEYLLGKTGMFRIKAYNHTNNDIFRTSNATQGIGFSFVRESKQFRNLFNIREEFNQKKREEEEKKKAASNNKQLLTPNSTQPTTPDKNGKKKNK